MIHSIYNLKDTTIYEQYTNLNTGLDSVLDIRKDFINDTPYNSRILVKFDTNEILNLVSQNIATDNNTKYFLKLYSTEASEIPVDYSLYAYPITGSWNMGTGRYTTSPSSSNGATWLYRLNSSDSSTQWVTSSFGVGVTGSWTVNPGGANWAFAYAASQSFSYSTADVNMDVTSIVKAWLNGNVQNEGFIVKKGSAEEASTDTFQSIKFFGKDTHTIYQPRLEIRYDDSMYHTSCSLVDLDDEVAIGLANQQATYLADTKARINVVARPKYPPRTFTTGSDYMLLYQLPETSYYSIVDAQSNDTLIPFDDNFTKISADSKGSFFRVGFSSMQPERYYKFLIKVRTADSDEYIYDKNWIFKVVNSVNS